MNTSLSEDGALSSSSFVQNEAQRKRASFQSRVLWRRSGRVDGPVAVTTYVCAADPVSIFGGAEPEYTRCL